MQWLRQQFSLDSVSFLTKLHNEGQLHNQATTCLRWEGNVYDALTRIQSQQIKDSQRTGKDFYLKNNQKYFVIVREELSCIYDISLSLYESNMVLFN